MGLLTALTVKKFKFQKSKMATTAILETVKSPHLGNYSAILMKFGKVMHIGPQSLT